MNTRLLVLLLFLFQKYHSQNIVLNGSFENYNSCPTNLSGLCGNGPGDQLLKCPPWYAPTCGSEDFLHTCATPASAVSVPDNYPGYQNARTGLGYIGGQTYSQAAEAMMNIQFYREYAQAPLAEPLEIGKKYCVSFWVSRGENGQYAIKEIGALFTTQAYINKGGNYQENIPLTPQIVNTGGPITDTINWVEISGDFIADSAYAYITLGNFKGRNQSTVLHVPKWGTPGVSYYFFDDVSVYKYPELDLGGDLIYTGEQYLLDAQNVGASYIWSTGDTTQTIMVSNQGKYWVEVTNECASVSDTIEIVGVESIYYPNAFTPNDDGLNDVFKVESYQIPSYDFYIYNRWGELVFSGNEKQNTWNGKLNNTFVANGVYVLILDYKLNNQEQKKQVDKLVVVR